MKRLLFLLLAATLITFGCQYQQKAAELDAAREAVIQLADTYLDAWNIKDLAAIEALATNDGLYLGSDPSEMMNKAAMLDMIRMVFADTTADYSYTVDIRKIKLADDRNSALVSEYISMSDWTPILQLRQTFHFIKSADAWKIDFISWGFVAKNEDVNKLNQALE